MKTPVWLLKETVLALHERLLADFGGSAGLRDEGLLDSALARPENLFAYDTPTVFDLAASYAFGLVKNHPFIDGNERVGFAAALVFLEINGRRFHASEADATIQTLALAAGAVNEVAYATWLKANSKRA
jgi:death-on-curing protein